MAVTIGDLFATAVEKFPHRPFLRVYQCGVVERVTYGLAAVRVAAATRFLHGLGLRRGHRVVCYLDETKPSVYFALACGVLGVSICPLSSGYSLGSLHRLAERVDTGVLFTTPDRAPQLVASDKRVIAYVPPGQSVGGIDPIPFPDQGESDASVRYLRTLTPEVLPGDAWAILNTSGTTGEPKLLLRTHESFTDQAPLLALDLDDEEPQKRVLLAAVLTHAMGLSNLTVGLLIAAEIGVPTAPDVGASLSEVRDIAPNYMTITPRVIRSLLRQADAEAERRPVFGPGPMIVRLTGAAPDLGLMDRLAQEGVDVGECYGAQEIGLITMTPRNGWRRGWTGRTCDDMTVKISAEGEILVKSSRALVGYLGDEDLNRSSFTPDGFYRTGDFGELTADGYLRFAGRKKDLFNTAGGDAVYPARIEEMIEALSWVEQVALVGDQRPHLAALIVVRPCQSAGTDDGFLDPGVHVAAYERAHRDIAQLNSRLEPVERVRLVALFGIPMPAPAYARIGPGKTRRDRKGIEAAYRSRIEDLYAKRAAEGAFWVGDDRPDREALR